MSLTLEEHYARLERRFPPRVGTDYERLVVAQGNTDESVHRWFHMKEAYSPYLLNRVLKDLDIQGFRHLRLIDPFVGSGTTLVSALTLSEVGHVTAVGLEINPFLQLLASAKVASLSLSPPQRRELVAALEEGAARTLVLRRGGVTVAPALAAFQDERYFPAEQLGDLLRLRMTWQQEPPSLCRDLLAVALAGCLEACSRLRRDGRALRYERDKRVGSPRTEFQRRVTQIVTDLRSVDSCGNGKVSLGSALDKEVWPRPDTDPVDLIVFSPPYPNNIDYTEVYKLEAWFLGFIDDTDSFRRQRRATMRSHPSVLFEPRGWSDVPTSLLSAAEQLAAPLVAAVPRDRYRHQRARVIEGYLADAAVLLWRCYRVLKPGGHAVYVVGNSRHGSGDDQYAIASDVLLAALAEEVGFEVVELKTARSLHRRGKHAHLRESVVFLQKGNT